MRDIIFVASELSIVTGHNKYEKPVKVLDAVLNRSHIVKKYIPKTKIEEAASKDEVDSVAANIPVDAGTSDAMAAYTAAISKDLKSLKV